MTSHLRRAVVRAGAAAVLAAGALATLGAPAQADDDVADLALRISGTTLAATTEGKVANVTITNLGALTATDVVLILDLRKLDTDKVAVEAPDADACRTKPRQIVCDVVDVPAGHALDLGVRLTRKAGTGPAGELDGTVTFTGLSPDSKLNRFTSFVEVVGSGPDLYAYAPDVPFDLKTGTVGTVEPGGTATLHYEVGNFGDVTVKRFRVTIVLPGFARFAERRPGCTYDGGLGAACTFDLTTVPAHEDKKRNDDIFSAYQFAHRVKIGDDVPSPVDRRQGSVTVKALRTLAEAPAVERFAASTLPEGVVGATATDVDNTDNTDEFVIHVAESDGGGGGLPVTGARAGLIGGVGLGALLVGGVLVLIARRRRVVLVPPSDETPTA